MGGCGLCRFKGRYWVGVKFKLRVSRTDGVWSSGSRLGPQVGGLIHQLVVWVKGQWGGSISREAVKVSVGGKSKGRQ